MNRPGYQPTGDGPHGPPPHGPRRQPTSVQAPNPAGVVPPPMRVVLKGWWRNHEYTKAEAEAHHLREAAKLAADLTQEGMERYRHHLDEAMRNRVWRLRGELLDRHVEPCR